MTTRWFRTWLLLSTLFSVVAIPVLADQPLASDAPLASSVASFLAKESDEGSVEGRGWIPYAGVEATFLAPQFGTGSGDTVVINDLNTPATYLASGSDANLSYLGLAPRFWIGSANESGNGIRGRYWQLNQSSTVGNPFNPVLFPGDLSGNSASNIFRVYAADLEGTKAFCWNNWDLMASFGVRHASVAQQSAVSATGLVPVAGGSDLLYGTASSGSQFNGTGLTFGIQGVQPICENCCGSFGLYASARGSVLWGTAATSASTSATIIGPGLQNVAVDGANGRGDEELYIAEFQIGGQWTRPLKCCNSVAFARLTAEYQWWDVSGSGRSTATSPVFRAANDDITATANGINLSSLDFIGFGIATGFYW